MLREREGREPSPSAAVDRHPEREDDGKGGPRGWDAAKKVKGRKRHVAVDTSGLLLGVIVHAADIQDADGAGDLLRRLKRLYPWLKVVFADSAYDRLAALLACFLLGLTLVVIRRLAGDQGLRPPPAPLGGGADARLARPLAAAGQGIRGAARGLGDHGQAGHDPPHAAPPRPPEPQAATRTLTSQTAS